MGDLFESCLNLEQQHISDGHQSGITDGRAAGLLEGRALGDRKGNEIGYEVGLYEGCVEGWRMQQAQNPAMFSARADATMASLQQLLMRLPLNDPKDESMPGILDAARGKFKTIVAILGTAHLYATPAAATGNRQQPATPAAPDLDF